MSTERMPDETLATGLHLVEALISQEEGVTLPERWLARSAVAELQTRIADKTNALAAEKNKMDELLRDFSWLATRAAMDGDHNLHDFWKTAHHAARIHAGDLPANSGPEDCDCKTNYPMPQVAS